MTNKMTDFWMPTHARWRRLASKRGAYHTTPDTIPDEDHPFTPEQLRHMKCRREALGLTAYGLSDIMGCGTNAVLQWESGRVAPDRQSRWAWIHTLDLMEAGK